jgi:hypothetical protein
MRTDQELITNGFTESGKKRYIEAVGQYSDALFNTSIKLAEASKASDTNIEVTHEYVRDAAIAISKRKEKPSMIQIFLQIGEYVCTALVGVGSGNINQKWGILLFGFSSAIGVILFISRVVKGNK